MVFHFHQHYTCRFHIPTVYFQSTLFCEFSYFYVVIQLVQSFYIIRLSRYIMISSDLQLGKSTKHVVQSHTRPESPLMRPLNRLWRQPRELIH